MAKRYRIKWRLQDRKTLARTVKNFNAKITRLEKKHPELKEFLPEKISVKDLKSNIETRQDFNRQIKSLKRFSKRGAEKPVLSNSGITTTAWEKKEVGYKVALLNRKRKAEREKANVSTEKGTMGTIENAGLNPKKYDINSIEPSSWERFKKNVEKQIKSSYFDEKKELYKQNYIKAFINVFGSGFIIGFESVLQKLKDMPADELVDLYYNDPVMELDFIYDPLEYFQKFTSIQERLNNL